jgi:hypothetical protein
MSVNKKVTLTRRVYAGRGGRRLARPGSRGGQDAWFGAAFRVPDLNAPRRPCFDLARVRVATAPDAAVNEPLALAGHG